MISGRVIAASVMRKVGNHGRFHLMMDRSSMYTYSDIQSIKANRPLQASIGCSCGAAGVLVTSEPLATAMCSRVCLLDSRIWIRCACLICGKQGYVSISIDDCWRDADEDDLRALLERCQDYLFSEKRCEHKHDICLSASLHNDQWSHVYTAAPRIHVVYCAKCRKRGPMQFPIGMSDYINEVMNHE